MAEEDKRWMILNMNGVCEEIYSRPGTEQIPKTRRPTVVYHDKNVAENELLRLQGKYSDCEYVLFESVAQAVPGLFDRGILFIEPI